MSPEKDEVSAGSVRSPGLEGGPSKMNLPKESGLTEQNVEAKHKKREKRHVSPSINLSIDNFFEAPLSPSSSSSVDATFEPSIDMMVNDFDDEQTLNEEEALAEHEAHNVQDEIDNLKEESEMPLEELLAKYGAMLPMEPPSKKSKIKKNKKKLKKTTQSNSYDKSVSKFLEKTAPNEQSRKDNTNGDSNSIQSNNSSESENCDNDKGDSFVFDNIEVRRQNRSHLLDLYPKSTIATLLPDENNKELYGEIYEEDDELDEYTGIESDYPKSEVMVGEKYQALIPEGLSQYGDILPYENEDKLVWEPSQVSEKKVEEYLLKIRNIKSTKNESEQLNKEGNLNTDQAGRTLKDIHFNESLSNSDELTKTSVDLIAESGNVKDDEQALHLLVQCGYDFKEAIRRKSLNVFPLTDSMSLWSEEECQKFEEGIRTFGKDFLKIRQQNVRTRSIREIVQFYYIWKKSERFDQTFTNSDTVDHMDIYLNESSEYDANSQLNGNVANSLINGSGAKKTTVGNTKNFSIMTKNAPAANFSSNNKLNTKRRSVSLQDCKKDGSPLEFSESSPEKEVERKV